MFDRTIQNTYLWIGDVCDELRIDDRAEGFRCLRAVLQTLRDQLDPVEAAHLASQMTPLLRGVYFEGWTPGRDCRTRSSAEFCDTVVERHGARPFVSPEEMCACVGEVVRRRVGDAEYYQVMDRLPEKVWTLFRQRVPVR